MGGRHGRARAKPVTRYVPVSVVPNRADGVSLSRIWTVTRNGHQLGCDLVTHPQGHGLRFVHGERVIKDARFSTFDAMMDAAEHSRQRLLAHDWVEV